MTAAVNGGSNDGDLYDVSDREEARTRRKKVKTEAKNDSTSVSFAIATSTTTVANKRVLIGTVKKGEDNLPVRAEQYRNGTVNYRVHREDVLDDMASRQSDFLSTKRQVQLHEVLYDPALFPRDNGVPDIQTSTEAEKRTRVRAYLATLAGGSGPVSQPAPKSSAASTSTTGHPSNLEQPAPITEAVSKRRVADAATTKMEKPTSVEPASTSKLAPEKSTCVSAKESAKLATPIPDSIPTNSTSSIFKDSTKPVVPIPQASPKKKAATNKKKKKGPANDFSADMFIGAWKPQPNVDIYAHLKTYGVPPKMGNKKPFSLGVTACYRVHDNEVDEETRAMGNWPVGGIASHRDIEFQKRFAKDSESETRAVIKAVLLDRREQRKQQAAADSDDDFEDEIDVEEKYVASLFASRNTSMGITRSRGVATRTPVQNTKDTGIAEDDDDGYESQVCGKFKYSYRSCSLTTLREIEMI